jgi:hypothetical protein
MPVWSALLRIVLGVTLMLNGVTSAMASVQMEAMHVRAAIEDGQRHLAATTGVMPCHQDGSHEAGGMHDKEEGSSGHAKHPDCCKSSTCRCACLFSAQATVPTWAMAPTVIAHTDSVRALALGHAPPALPHLIRPPIA